MRLLLTALAAALLVTGCGGDAAPEPSTTAATAAGTKLTITVYPQGRGDPVFAKWELECDPDGGTLPDPEAACDAVASADPKIFEPLPADTVCTQQFGGPEAADVEGTLDGRPIQAQFARFDGCQIDRWEQLKTLFPAASAT